MAGTSASSGDLDASLLSPVVAEVAVETIAVEIVAAEIVTDEIVATEIVAVDIDEAEIAAVETDEAASIAEGLTLAALPLGARLILRCRKDWRYASVSAFIDETAQVVLSVSSPSGHTYRIRRPRAAALTLDGHVPVLGEGEWRAGLARYDTRW